MNKFSMRSPPKILAAIEPNKFKKPNSRSQQKSFDVNAGPITAPITKYTPYLSNKRLFLLLTFINQIPLEKQTQRQQTIPQEIIPIAGIS